MIINILQYKLVSKFCELIWPYLSIMAKTYTLIDVYVSIINVLKIFVDHSNSKIF